MNEGVDVLFDFDGILESIAFTIRITSIAIDAIQDTTDVKRLERRLRARSKKRTLKESS